MKRNQKTSFHILAVLLVCVLLMSALAGCKSTEKASNPKDTEKTGNPKDNATVEKTELKPLSFTVYSLDDAPDMMDWPLVKEAKEKFNFDFKIQHVAWDSWDETTRTLVATDSLPEVLAWYDLIYGEYIDWANQGVFEPLPDDFSAYPNLKELIETNSIFEKITVDGKLYAFPKINNSNPWNEYANFIFIYRKDWASAIGKNFDDVQALTWDEFVDYLEEIKANDPGHLGESLIPFDTVHGGISWINLLAMQFNPYIGGFEKIEDNYVWGTEQPSSIEGLKKLNEMYNDGLIYRDSYMDTMGAGTERFIAGRSAVFFTPISPAQLQPMLEEAANVQGITVDDYGLINIKQPDGKFKVNQKIEWWGAFAFRAGCDDAIIDRWLQVGDWLLDLDQVEKAAYGIYGEDWTRNGDTVVLNYDRENLPEEKQYIQKQKDIFQKFFILEGLETFLPGNPAVNQHVLNIYKDMMDMFDSNPLFTPTDYDVAYFSSEDYDTNSGELTSETNDAIIQTVISSNPENTWNDFLNAGRASAQVCVEELNKEFGK